MYNIYMSTVRRKWDIYDDEQRADHISKIINILDQVNIENVGVITAGILFDSVKDMVAPDIYNMAIADT